MSETSKTEQSPKPQAQKEAAYQNIEAKVRSLSEAQQVNAEGLVDLGVPEAAASYLSTHETVDDLFGSLYQHGANLNSEQIKTFSQAVFKALRGMTDAIIMGRTDRAEERIANIAESPDALAQHVINAVSEVGGSVGHQETRFVSDYKL